MAALHNTAVKYKTVLIDLLMNTRNRENMPYRVF